MFTTAGLLKMWPLWLGTALYIMQAINFLRANDTGMLIVFTGYSIANLGLIYAGTRGLI